MGAVPCVEDDRTDNAGRIRCRAFRLVSHDDGIYAHRLDGIKRIPEAFAFDDTARPGSDIDNVRSEIFAGELK